MDDALSGKIKEIEEEIKTTKYNKKSQHHIGLLKAKLAALKEKHEARQKKGKGDGYTIKKSGDATVAMIGFPSVGKSTLLNMLTNANSKVAPYDFTTLTMIPGLLEYNHAQIQIFDVPGIVEGAAAGTGRGKEVLAAVRSADMLLILLDIKKLHHKEIIEAELQDSGIRINRKMPDIRIKKVPKGGIQVSSTVRLEMEDRTIAAILNEFKIINAHVLIRSKISEDDLIDVVEANKIYLPAIEIINKIDSATPDELEHIRKRYPDALLISAEKGTNIEELKKQIYSMLGFVNIYLKQPGKKPDLEEPIILREAPTIRDICGRLHKDLVNKFRFARVWGKSAKYDGQKIVNIDFLLTDQDVLELHFS